MRRLFILVLAVGLSLGLTVGSLKAQAPNQANQSVQMEIMAINSISLSGNFVSLVIDYAEPGQDPNPATDSSKSYSISTNASNRKIVGSINSDMPPLTRLRISLAAPQGATSTGFQELTTTPKDLVLGISKLKSQGLPITYEFSAQIEAEPQVIQRTVTLVLTGGN